MTDVSRPKPVIPKRSRLTTVAILAGVLGFSIITFLIGFLVATRATPSAPARSALESFFSTVTSGEGRNSVRPEVLSEVWSLVTSRYLNQPVDERTLFYGAVAGIVESLKDPYSTFFPPDLTERFQDELSGSFEGIGAEVAIKDGRLTVVAPLPDSPAEHAGLKAGDRIAKIDDQETADMALDLAVSLMRGKKGTDVRLTIQREEAEPTVVTVRRAAIRVDSVHAERRGDVAYVKISQFGTTTTRSVVTDVSKLLLDSPKGIILDLRNDPGGYLSSAIDVAGAFLPGESVVVQEVTADGTTKADRSESGGRFLDIPLVVLVDGGSASAAEIVAGALQDHRRATVVGEKTFGKGSVQDFQEFSDGSSLKLTVARWLTPDGRSIDQAGITPDVVVELTDADFDADRDPQLDRAVELLTAAR